MRIARLITVAVVVMAGVSLTATPAQRRPAGRTCQSGPLARVGGTLIDGSGGCPD
jgi:hypothetical protein